MTEPIAYLTKKGAAHSFGVDERFFARHAQSRLGRQTKEEALKIAQMPGANK